MPTLIKNIVFLVVIFLITSCTMEQKVAFWNGEYSSQATQRDARKKEEAYYTSKSPEWMAQYKLNRTTCSQKSNAMSRKTHDEIVKAQNFYKICMEERGTPVFSYKG